MSGFAVVYDRSNTPVNPGVLERIMQRLDHRGPDGQDSRSYGPAAMGHQHFWTTPEESGEDQPLKLHTLPYLIVMDGRLDNRSDVIKRLNMYPEEGGHLSDAALVLHCYDRWNTDCFQFLIGEFALVIWDQTEGELICARDVVGDRTLFYSLQGTYLLIASEPWAVAGGLNKKVELDERAISYHFALQIPKDGQTLFTGIYELMPAHWLKVSAVTKQSQHYWRPDLEKRKHNRSDEDYVEEFRELLEVSVRCRLRSNTPPAVMMSGGLDSTSIACLAAKMLAPNPLTTISYVFNDFPQCDEREYINVVQEKYGIRSIQIPCDDCWPFKTLPDWPLDPNWPPSNPYRLILEKTYAKAKDDGLKVMLSGMYGDILYSGSSGWLTDLFLDHRIGQLGRELDFLIKKYGLRKIINSKIMQRSIKKLLLQLPGTQYLRRSPTTPRWLSDFASSKLDFKRSNLQTEKQSALFNLRDAAGNSREIYNTARYGLEIRTPYHDRRLIEFYLKLPGYLLYEQGTTKRILRIGMEKILPENILLRSGATNLLSLYNYGIQQKKGELQKIFEVDDNHWQKYVKPDEVLKEWSKEISSATDGPNKVIPSLCLFYNLWYKSLNLALIDGGCNG